MLIFICNRCAQIDNEVRPASRFKHFLLCPGPTAGADMIYTGKQAMLFGGTGGIALDHNT